jgi:hypothetical protein
MIMPIICSGSVYSCEIMILCSTVLVIRLRDSANELAVHISHTPYYPFTFLPTHSTRCWKGKKDTPTTKHSRNQPSTTLPHCHKSHRQSRWASCTAYKHS